MSGGKYYNSSDINEITNPANDLRFSVHSGGKLHYVLWSKLNELLGGIPAHTHEMLPILVEYEDNTDLNITIDGPAVSVGQIWETTVKIYIDQSNNFFDSRQSVILSDNSANGFQYNNYEVGTTGLATAAPVGGILQAGFTIDPSVQATPKLIGFTYRRLC